MLRKWSIFLKALNFDGLAFCMNWTCGEKKLIGQTDQDAIALTYDGKVVDDKGCQAKFIVVCNDAPLIEEPFRQSEWSDLEKKEKKQTPRTVKK